MSDRYLSIDEVVELLHTSRGALYTQRHRGEAPGALGAKVGRKLLWREADIENWFLQQRADEQRLAAGYGSHLTEAEQLLARTAPRTFRLYVRDGKRCGICKRTCDPMSATVDHIVPQSQHGGNDPSNLQLAHFICNTRKGDREQPLGAI